MLPVLALLTEATAIRDIEGIITIIIHSGILEGTILHTVQVSAKTAFTVQDFLVRG